jgi:hypothetical protein
MFRSVGARLGVALSLSALVLAAVAGPAAAVSHTRWVDNDNKPGDGPAACDTAHFHTIQAAVDASSAGDRIFVCPGTYKEQVIVNTPNLLIQAKPTRTATIVPPEADQIQEVENGFDLVDILANGVSLIGFKMNIPAGDLGPNLVPATTCIELDTAVYVDANNVNVEANTMKAVGDNSVSGACGYAVGVGVVGQLLPAVGHTAAVSGYGPETSDISGNRIVDFKFAGVLLEGELSAKVYRNSIRFIHANDPATCVLTPVLGLKSSLTFPCDPPAGVVSKQSDGIFQNSAGILVEGSLADLRGNSIYSTFDISICFISDTCPVFLSGGIVMLGEAPGSIVRNNRTNNVGIGIALGFAGVPVARPSALPEAPNGTQVTGNRLNESFVGLGVGESDSVFYGNRAHLNFGGVVVEDPATDNVFDSNDFRYNLEGDCIDQTTGTGTSNTANNWNAINFGSNNEPTDICTDIGPF